ncbi:DUF6955 family protein [uncultured Desulfosarcina sp.]|uniref:DUF6955 family protein n=1 Tax=uncultured Desulfosarcina sp. TaxID=218289 RepID=UPI0029C910BB|nr:hypothetical protein [uncultured Desulfosarcina sp.]
MADYYINVILDEAKKAKISEAGLADKIVTIDGKEAVQVEMSRKEQKKLVKGFSDLSFDDSNACQLPAEAEATLLGIIADMQTLDVMKLAIMKLYNPLAGKAPRAALR